MSWKSAWTGGAAAGVAAGLVGLALRYASGTARADRSWPAQVEPRLRELGEVDEVSILPVVERLTANGRGLVGEPGVRTWFVPATPGRCSTRVCPAAASGRRWSTTRRSSAPT